MNSPVTRRGFLGGTAATGLGFVFAGSGSLDAFVRPASVAPRPTSGYGPLVADPKGILALPEGFSYTLGCALGRDTDDRRRPSE